MSSATINIADNLNEYLSSSSGTRQSEGLSGWLNRNAPNTAWFYSPLAANEDGIMLVSPDESNTGTRFQSTKCCDWLVGLLPTLTRTQRFVGFIACLVFGFTCFTIASFYIPILVFKARKFALLFTLGSCFILSSFFFLNGPWSQFLALTKKDKLPFTGCYLTSLIATLYTSLWMQSTILTIIFAIIQLFSLFWYLLNFIPGSTTSFMFMAKLFGKAASKTLPI